jgi:hypothetical protein
MSDNFAKGVPLTLLFYALVRSAPVLAGEHATSDFQLPASAVPPSFSLGRPVAENRSFSATEFSPRKSSMRAADSARKASALFDAPMLQDTSVWQQLTQYRSQDRLRLLTLWQARGSTLSLQTGRHGGPSLQWSTPWMNREDAPRGLFDRLIPAPSRGAATPYRGIAAHPASAQLSAPAPSLRDLAAGMSAK